MCGLPLGFRVCCGLFVLVFWVFWCVCFLCFGCVVMPFGVVYFRDFSRIVLGWVIGLFGVSRCRRWVDLIYCGGCLMVTWWIAWWVVGCAGFEFQDWLDCSVCLCWLFGFFCFGMLLGLLICVAGICVKVCYGLV